MLDEGGIHFDPSSERDPERFRRDGDFDPAVRVRAGNPDTFIVYNHPDVVAGHRRGEVGA